MSSSREEQAAPGVDVGEYCRAVEAHLTRINGGQLVRVVGPAFELVRGWALAGVPLSIVFHGMTEKAARHRAGRSTRPLRLEFCEDDVRAAYDAWRRAVGISRVEHASWAAADPAETSKRHPSLTKHLDRAIERLVRVGGRLDLPDGFRDEIDRGVQRLSLMREDAKGARGPAREGLAAELPAFDEALMMAARAAAGASTVDRIRKAASDELGPYRGRLTPEAWARSVELGVDRLLREHFALPTLVFEP